MGSRTPMETLGEALIRLGKHGYERGFRPRAGGLLDLDGTSFAPEDLVLEEIVRFEGESDPQDEAVLFALRTSDAQQKGTFVASYGPGMDALSVAVVERLTAMQRQRKVEGPRRADD